MPPPPEGKKTRTIRRSHSGCKQCRRRGKKCDETKPICGACTRLRLECSYGIDYTFRNANAELSNKEYTLSRGKCTTAYLPKHAVFTSETNIESAYLDHFITHVRYLLPSISHFTEKTLLSPPLRSAVLCLAASNLSMLNVHVQNKTLPSDPRRSVSSPLVNKAHHLHARNYHDHAIQHCTVSEEGIPAVLTAHTLLAYYHHASTDHRLFRLAVWDTIRFVSNHRQTLTRSSEGWSALQLWYRLCISHRLGKPPSLLLEGEGLEKSHSRFGPSQDPENFEDLYLSCILNMSTDDIIYDILIKSIEIRNRLVVFQCVAGMYGSSVTARDIGGVAHELLNNLIGRDSFDGEIDEAQKGFVRGSHLQSLLDIQGERLKVWESRLREDQQPDCTTFPTHRDAMDALYAILVEMMIAESSNPSILHYHANRILQILPTLDLTASATADIYTFSLSEVLLKLVQIYQSDMLFAYILDILWPELERKSRGYEHSHYPTHLAKRIIAQLARYYDQGKRVCYAVPAANESTTKVQLLDVNRNIGIVCCGWSPKGYFVERNALL